MVSFVYIRTHFIALKLFITVIVSFFLTMILTLNLFYFGFCFRFSFVSPLPDNLFNWRRTRINKTEWKNVDEANAGVDDFVEVVDLREQMQTTMIAQCAYPYNSRNSMLINEMGDNLMNTISLSTFGTISG